MDKEGTTKIQWEHPVADVKERYQKGLEAYAYLKNDSYQHKREQLLLMLRQGCSDEFIKMFFADDSGISSGDLDLLRAIALFAGEDFVKETFYKKTVSDEQAKQLLISHLFEKKHEQIPKIEEMFAKIGSLQEQFFEQMEFVKTEREKIQTQYEEGAKKEKELTEIEVANLKKEAERYKKKCTALQEEVAREIERRTAAEEELDRLKEAEKEQEAEELRKEAERLREKCSVLKEAAEENTEIESKGYFQKLLGQREVAKARKKKAVRNQFITNVVTDPAYSKEQLDVIVKAARSNVELEQLQKICNPKLPAENMKILAMYFEQGGEHRYE